MREISSLPLRLNITTFIYEHQMKIYDLIVAGIVLMVLYDGFNSEFMNPTIFDIVKWICCITMIVIYILYKKRGKNNG